MTQRLKKILFLVSLIYHEQYRRTHQAIISYQRHPFQVQLPKAIGASSSNSLRVEGSDAEVSLHHSIDGAFSTEEDGKQNEQCMNCLTLLLIFETL